MICIQKELFLYRKQNLKNGYKFLSRLHQRSLIRLRIKLSENVVLRVRDKPTSLDPQLHSPSSVAATSPPPDRLRWRGPTRSGRSLIWTCRPPTASGARVPRCLRTTSAHV